MSKKDCGSKRLLSVDDACIQLGGICRGTFYRLATEKRLPLYRLRRLTRVRQADLDAVVSALPQGRSPSPNPRVRPRSLGGAADDTGSPSTPA